MTLLAKPPLRILHVIPSIGAARGGPSFVIRTLARAQAEQGMEVHVAATDDDGPDRRTPSRALPFVEQSVTYWIFPRQTSMYLFSLPLTRWLRKRISDYELIHIHALFSYSSAAAAWCASSAGVPYLVRPLGTLSSWGMANRRRWLKRWSYRCIESRILNGSAAIQYTCQQELEEARRLGVPDRGVVIPNPVDLPAAPARSERKRAPQLLFLSRLDPKKGLDLLLPAFARVRSRCPQTVLKIAGNGDASFVEGLNRRISGLGLESSVIWAGFLQGEAKREAFAQADLFVLPSYSENFGVAVVEAMGTGLPVVVSDQVGIHREIANAGAGLVTGCTVDELEAALMRCLDDATLRAAMARRAMELAATFSPGAVTEKLLNAYERISRRQQPVAA
jgi:glycosyltransferase involved in cell wall biosynthesis